MHHLLARSTGAAVALVVFVAGFAAAGTEDWQPPRLEVGGFGGIMDFDLNRGLNGEVFGGRLGYNITPSIGFEGVVGVSRASSNREDTASRSTLWISHVDAVWHVLPGMFQPYISGGLGGLSSSDAGLPADAPNFRSGFHAPSQMHLSAGGGIKVWMSKNVALRGDMHAFFGTEKITPDDSRGYRDIMATVGLSVGMGTSKPAPLDVDADGIPDLSDRCPDTPLGVEVDTFGCPADTDGDGVPDYRDGCENTARHVWVDSEGCPTDEDGDGVFDGVDVCNSTPRGARVDDRGCPTDEDGDGVYDGLDRCTETPLGVIVDAKGCPEAKKIEQHMVLHSITFSSGKADILPSSYGSLDEVAASLIAYPNVKVEVRGYADSMGSESLNLKLTQQRAASVREYLIVQGVEPERLRSRGFGESNPIAPNDTPEGRAMNRRVEFMRIDQ